MTLKELENNYQTLIPELFRFIYIMTGNTLTSEKLLWSTFEAGHIDRQSLLAMITENSSRFGEYADYRLNSFKLAYTLSYRSIVNKNDPPETLFYTLTPTQKAVVYLRHQTMFSFQEMADILDKEKIETCSILYEARDKLYPFSKTFLEAKCFYSRQIPALMDLNIGDERYLFLIKHATKCKDCTQLYNRSIEMLDNITKLIPKASLSKKSTLSMKKSLIAMVKKFFSKRKSWNQFILNT